MRICNLSISNRHAPTKGIDALVDNKETAIHYVHEFGRKLGIDPSQWYIEQGPTDKQPNRAFYMVVDDPRSEFDEICAYCDHVPLLGAATSGPFPYEKALSQIQPYTITESE